MTSKNTEGRGKKRHFERPGRVLFLLIVTSELGSSSQAVGERRVAVKRSVLLREAAGQATNESWFYTRPDGGAASIAGVLILHVYN